MTPLLLVAAGFVMLALGGLVLATYGSRFRLGRLLGGTRRVSIDDAIAIAQRGEARFVRVEGRIDSEQDFEDEHHRPLVFRRQRIEAREGGGWRRLDERREVVDFELQEGLSSIRVDHAALGEGLIVIPREAVGNADEARLALGNGPSSAEPLASKLLASKLPAESEVRLRVEQLSSVEHAVALGRPIVGADGEPVLTAGLGRPLVLTTLEVPEAMRILTAGERLRPITAAVLLVAGALTLLTGLAWALASAVA